MTFALILIGLILVCHALDWFFHLLAKLELLDAIESHVPLYLLLAVRLSRFLVILILIGYGIIALLRFLL